MAFTEMDWNQCVICQKKTKEALKCPLNAKGTRDKSKAYENFLKCVREFRELEQLPVSLIFGADMDATELVTKQGKWHKSCYLKFNESKLQRARKRTRDELNEMEQGLVSTRNLLKRKRFEKSKCIFCEGEGGTLHEFRTLDADTNVRKMATELQDTALLARIAGGGDLPAQEAKYHFTCLTAIRNKHRSIVRQQGCASSVDCQTEARVFVELIMYIENCMENGTLCFKFSELRQLYQSRLQDLGISKEKNKRHFRDQVLSHFENAQEQSDGKNSLLVFDHGIQQLLKNSQKEADYKKNMLILQKAANIVRSEIYSSSSKCFNFNASFPQHCQEASIPPALKLLTNMILTGGDIKDQQSTDTQACLTVAQTILFNCKRKGSSKINSRHSLKFEPPLPLYIGLNVHTLTRSKKLVTELYKLGLSVSYDRVMQLESELAISVCDDFKTKGVVCPTVLRKGLFTMAALDNIDHNPSSTTAKGSFHGTGISLFQCPTSTNLGIFQENLALTHTDESKKPLELPDYYSTVPAVAFRKESVTVPEHPNEITSVVGNLNGAKAQEKCWTDCASKLINKESLDSGDKIAWSAYHASVQNRSKIVQPALTQLLPLFYEKAASIAMVKHGMDVIKKATDFLNPRQVPVIAFDAPLFALAKQVQWNWPMTHGETEFVVMFGGLHIEMAMWKTFGDFLESSGWTVALSQAGIANAGVADSFLKASHLTRTRHAHQISALALSKLQHDAFLQYGGLELDEAAEESWKANAIDKSPTFAYWDMVLRLELLGLILVRAHRQTDFSLYVETLKAVAPWFFALDHQNYARWIPVHIRDMESLPKSIYQEFQKHGHWVVQKTANRFSAMPIDQAHEQNNELVKGLGGAVGLTENPSAFRKWMTAGPEQARLLKEFEEQFLECDEAKKHDHHEEGFRTQKTFREEAANLIAVINEMGNPFIDITSELLTLDTRDILDESVVNTIRTIETLGIEQLKTYQKAVLFERTGSIHDAIKKNSLPLFRCPIPKPKAKQAGQISNLKHDVQLFSRLYIVMQHRNADMSTFFKHENHSYPPSLSDNGKIRFGKKSQLLGILVDLSVPTNLVPSSFDVSVLDGAAVVHMLPVKGASTFDEYVNDVFIPHTKKQLETSKRVDLVWDSYISNSIKDTTREKRGKGMRRKVEGKNRIPGNWLNFLRNPVNKEELFHFLSKKLELLELKKEEQIFATCGTNVLSIGTSTTTHMMSPCNHEEADTRMLIHALDAITHGATTCLIRTVDTDVIVIFVGMLNRLLTINPAVDVWVAFGSGRSFQYIHINSVYNALGKQKSIALPFFHAFTGCDTTSSFYGIGKKTAWEAWKSFPDATLAFQGMQDSGFIQLDVESNYFKVIERFCVVMYDKSSSESSIDETRKELFCQKNRTMETIPPTRDALIQHTRRVAYQAAIWTTSDEVNQKVPTPEGHGWTMDECSKSWLPVWTTSPLASKACSELVKCGCKKTCTEGRCGCKKANWKCTDLCHCNCDKS